MTVRRSGLDEVRKASEITLSISNLSKLRQRNLLGLLRVTFDVRLDLRRNVSFLCSLRVVDGLYEKPLQAPLVRNQRNVRHFHEKLWEHVPNHLTLGPFTRHGQSSSPPFAHPHRLCVPQGMLTTTFQKRSICGNMSKSLWYLNYK